MALVTRDLQGTGFELVEYALSGDDVAEMWVSMTIGDDRGANSGGGGVWVGGPTAKLDILDHVQVAISDGVSWGTAWPTCPLHGGHPMNAQSPTLAWACDRGFTVPLGELGTTHP